jgi:hypothetical protein
MSKLKSCAVEELLCSGMLLILLEPLKLGIMLVPRKHSIIPKTKVLLANPFFPK